MPSNGCIFKSSKSRYCQAKFTVRPGEKPVYRSTGETNKTLAVDRLRDMIEQARVNPSRTHHSSKITLADFCRLPGNGDSNDQGGEYWQYVVGNRAGTTQARYRDILRAQIIPQFGSNRFATVTPKMIEVWKQERLKEAQKGTVKKELDLLSNVFKMRIARKIYRYTRENPVADVERPKVPQKKLRIPSPVAVKAFLDAAAKYKPEHFPHLLALYMSGGRVDEVRHLEPTDVRDNATILTIRVKSGWSPKDAEDIEIFHLSNRSGPSSSSNWPITQDPNGSFPEPMAERSIANDVGGGRTIWGIYGRPSWRWRGWPRSPSRSPIICCAIVVTAMPSGWGRKRWKSWNSWDSGPPR